MMSMGSRLAEVSLTRRPLRTDGDRPTGKQITRQHNPCNPEKGGGGGNNKNTVIKSRPVTLRNNDGDQDFSEWLHTCLDSCRVLHCRREGMELLPQWATFGGDPRPFCEMSRCDCFFVAEIKIFALVGCSLVPNQKCPTCVFCVCLLCLVPK